MVSYFEFRQKKGRLRMRVAQKFELFLDTYRRPDGRRWTGQDLYEATGGYITRSYVSTLRKNKITNPGVDKLRTIAGAMGFPPELWFVDDPEPDAGAHIPQGEERWSNSKRLNHLFETIQDKRTARSYSNFDVARMSYGELSEEEVEGIRNGSIERPTVDQVLALAEVFGITPSYFVSKGGKLPLIDEAAIEVLGNQKSRAIASKSLDLSDGEKDLVIDMIERLGYLHDEQKGSS